MLRRRFAQLAGLVAASLAVGVQGFVSDDSNSLRYLLLDFPSRLEFNAVSGLRRLVKVSGNPKDVCRFVETYQDALWSGWRENRLVRERIENCKLHVQQSGFGYFDVSFAETRKAFEVASGRSVDSLNV